MKKSLTQYFVRLRVYAINGHYWTIEIRLVARDPHDALDLCDAWANGLKIRQDYSSTLFVGLTTEPSNQESVYEMGSDVLYDELRKLWTQGE